MVGHLLAMLTIYAQRLLPLGGHEPVALPPFAFFVYLAAEQLRRLVLREMSVGTPVWAEAVRLGWVAGFAVDLPDLSMLDRDNRRS